MIVLGAAAGGGLPQWNCGCDACRAARAGDLRARTQASVAVSGDGESWVLLDASPDVREQMRRTPALHPRGLRDTSIRAVVATGGDVDRIAGLLTLREGQPFDLFVAAPVARILDANPIFGVLAPQVRRVVVATDEPFAPAPGLAARLFATPGKVPLFLENGTPGGTDDDTTVGVEIVGAAGRICYVPACRDLPEALAARLAGADLLLFDGTVYRDDELPRLGASAKTGTRMGHLPIAGPDGSLARLAGLAAGRKIYIHVNNTNPVWRPGRARSEVLACGLEIAEDGMEIDVARGN